MDWRRRRPGILYPAKDRFEQVSAANTRWVLPNQKITALAVDKNNRLFIGTELGLAVVAGDRSHVDFTPMQCVVWVAISFVLCTWPPIKPCGLVAPTVGYMRLTPIPAISNTGISI